MARSPSLNQRYPSWRALKQRQRKLSRQALPELFARDPGRSQRYVAEAAGLRLDYSRHWLDNKTLSLFSKVWREAGVDTALERLLAGERVNGTEGRAAWHSALRSPAPPPEVADTLQRMEALVQAIHSGQWRGYRGEAITDVVNIGIGGSDLGPRLVTAALHAVRHPGIRCHFVSNIDPADLAAVLPGLDPARTLWIIASKSFTTLETLANAHAARQWFLQSARTADIPQHFVAISSAVDKAEAFGIAQKNIFPLWDWVGGRYSLWSAIGLPIALACGMEHFRALLRGAHAMDQHVREAQACQNLPGLLALLEIFYSQLMGAQSHAVLPYSHALRLLPEFLQQLEMESNGKGVDHKGRMLSYSSGTVVWGSAGTIGQHSFHQLLHQGTHLIPVDFILPLVNPAASSDQSREQQRQLVANCLAQSEAMLYGLDEKAVRQQLKQQGLSATEIRRLAPHKVIPGSRPHSLITLDALTPATLGALIALYEHKVYIQSVILGINAFDQWGVELGKQLSKPIHEALVEAGKPVSSSVSAVVERYRAL